MLPRKGSRTRAAGCASARSGHVEQQMAAELAPAELAEELVDVGGQARVLGRRKACGVPDLARADLAETQMRREPRGAVAVGPVAVAGVAGDAVVEERLKSRLGGGLAGLSSSRAGRRPNPGGSARVPSLRACRRRAPPDPCSVFGAGNGFGGSPSDCTRRQNGVNTRRPRFSLLRIWSGEARSSPAKRCAAMPSSVSAAATWSSTARCGACAISFQYTASAPDLAGDGRDHLSRWSLAQHERGTSLEQACLQGAQRLRQPPSGRAAQRPNARRAVVEHVKDRNRCVRLGGCGQGGMIGKAQVVAIPNDGGHARIGSFEFLNLCRGLCPLMRS